MKKMKKIQNHAVIATEKKDLASGRESFPMVTTKKGCESLGRISNNFSAKLNEFITNSIYAVRGNGEIPAVRLAIDYNSNVGLWEFCIADYNTCGMSRERLMEYLAVGTASGDGVGNIAGMGSTALFAFTHNVHPFVVASQKYGSDKAYCITNDMVEDPITHQVYAFIQKCKMEEVVPASLNAKKYGTPNTVVKFYTDEKTVRQLMPGAKNIRKRICIDVDSVRLAIAQRISIAYREAIKNTNGARQADIYVQDLRFHKTSNRPDMAPEAKETEWNRPIKAFDMDAAIRDDSEQSAMYAGKVMRSDGKATYIYRFGMANHEYLSKFGFMGIAPLSGFWDSSMENAGFDITVHGQSIGSNLIDKIIGKKRHPSMNHVIGEIIIDAPKTMFRVAADKSGPDMTDESWAMLFDDIRKNSVLPVGSKECSTASEMYKTYAERCRAAGISFYRNYTIGSSTGTKAPSVIEVTLDDGSVGYYVLQCKPVKGKSNPTIRDINPLIMALLMMEANGQKVLGAYFVCNRFTNGFAKDIEKAMSVLNKRTNSAINITVCNTKAPLVLNVPCHKGKRGSFKVEVTVSQ